MIILYNVGYLTLYIVGSIFDYSLSFYLLYSNYIMVCIDLLCNGTIAWLMGFMGIWLCDMFGIESVRPLFFFGFG